MARINAVSFREEHSIEAICRTVRAAGFDSIELSRPGFYEKLTTPLLRRRFADWARALGLSLLGFDCWVDVQPYDRADETIADFRRAIDWAADLNLGLLISHDPWAAVNAHRSASACLNASAALFCTVAELAVERGLRLVLEPHPDTRSMDNAWAIDLVDRVGEGLPTGSVGILYDCCHYGVGQPESYIDSIRQLGRRITHVHFSDGDRETYALHLPLGDGSLDLTAIVGALGEIDFAGTLTNDLYNYPLLADGAARNAPIIREVERMLGCQ
jgi:sugar phosphate isomerase/epimerase